MDLMLTMLILFLILMFLAWCSEDDNEKPDNDGEEF